MKPDPSPDDIARAGAVFEEHARFIEAVARRRVRADMVPDVVQDVGLALVQSLGSFRAEAKLTTWIFQVVVYAAGRVKRQENRQAWLADQLLELNSWHGPEGVGGPEDLDRQLDEAGRAQALHEAIGHLKPRHREAIRNDLSEAEHISGSRWTRLRARRKLLGLLEADRRMDL